MKNKNFAAFVLTHGRCDTMKTHETFRQAGYTGPIYFLVDNEDTTVGQYKERFGNDVIVFDKLSIANSVDEGDNFGDRRSAMYARNQCYITAKELGLTHFIMLDDDYHNIKYMLMVDGCEVQSKFKKLDDLLDAMVDFMKATPTKTIATCQSGDFFGGPKGKKKWLRKAMNTFVCATDRPIKWVGKINEDVTAYTVNGSRGGLFFSTMLVGVWQFETQQIDGGMSELYREFGTYRKSFYSVMYNPSFVKISSMGITQKRLHHNVKWRNAVPMILDESHKKE